MPAKSDEGRLHIVSLDSENVKRLRAVRIEPNGTMVVIGGRNAQGKTSVLDSIMYALAGKRSIPEEAVRRGADSAQVSVTIDNPDAPGEPLQVTRTMTPDGRTELRIETVDGGQLRSPQKLLDSFVGRVCFDPLFFQRMSPAEQQVELQRVLGLDFSDLDQIRLGRYESRTAVNREVQRLEGVLSDRPVHDGATELVDVGAASDALAEAVKQGAEWNAKEAAAGELESRLDAAVEGLKAAAKRADELEDLLERAKEAVKAAEVARHDLNQRAEKAKAEAAALSEQLPDVEALRGKVVAGEEHNRLVRANLEREEVARELEAQRQKAADLTKEIEDVDAQRRARITEAPFPVPGLALGEDSVLFNEIPMSQASHAEQLRVSFAVAMAANPVLRIALIRDGSALDEENLGMLAALAEEAGAQVWLERVGSRDPGAVIIEDGEVVASPKEEDAGR